MGDIFETFVTPATIFVCLVAYVMTYVVRTLVQGLWPAVRANRHYNEVFLPLGPIVNGALLGLMVKTFMWPDMFNKTVASRMMYGAVCGMFSAFLYSRVRSWLASKGTEMDLKVLPPPAKSVKGPTGGSSFDETPEDAPIGGKSEDMP
jgi:hypothetical protein